MRSPCFLLLSGLSLAAAAHSALPLRFEPNVGQTDPRVKYLCRGREGTLFLTPSEAVLALRNGVLRLGLSGMRANPAVEALDPLPGITNYFLGRDPQQWRPGVTAYARIRYRAVYPGIDLIFYGNDRRFEFDFIVAPGADPRQIRLVLDGADVLRLNEHGDLIAGVGQQEVRLLKPAVYQGDQEPLAGRYTLLGRGRVGFRVSGYDRRRALIIDPVLTYATYLGGNGEDWANAVAVDSAGNVYIAGYSESTNFPRTSGVFQNTLRGGRDAFVAKLNAEGTALIYSTLIGGDSTDQARGIALDSAGNAYLTGDTLSANFPTTPGAYRTTPYRADDMFVAKLNSAGTALVYSTYFGGRNSEASFAIAVDRAGSAHITGNTLSDDLPTTAPGAFPSSGGPACFVAKFNPAGSALSYARFLGGGAGRALTTDSDGNAYVTGSTFDNNFPTTTGALQTRFAGDEDAFVSKLTPGGSLVYSTYLGGNNRDRGHAIALDPAGNAYITGLAFSPDFPLRNPYQATCGCVNVSGPGGFSWGDAFIAKLDPAGAALVYSTFLGGRGPEGAFGIGVDSAGNAHVAGTTSGTPNTFPLRNPIQSERGGNPEDLFIAKFNAAGSDLIYATLLGGANSEDATALALDGAGNAHVVGVSRSLNQPTTAGAVQRTYGGGLYDAYVAKISDPSAPAGPSFAAAGVLHAASFGAGPVAPGLLVTFFGSGLGPAQLVGLRLTESGLVDTLLADTRVVFDGVPAPLIYVSATQASAVVPYAVAGKTTTLAQVEYKGLKSAAVQLAVAETAPGIFTADASGRGQGAILNQDQSYNSASNPAAKGSVVTLYLTGEGQTDPAGIDGKPAGAPLPLPRAPVSVRIGDTAAEVLYAGGAPGLVAGVLQLNARVPQESSSGSVPVVVTIGGRSSQAGVTLAIQ
jgi:uncharacterized protein (TIGR03437 family)